MRPTKPPALCSNIRDEITICSRHIDVLYAVLTHQPIGIIKLAQHLQLPQHQIRYSLRILENCGYIAAGTTGAIIPLETHELNRRLHAEIETLASNMEAFAAHIHNNPHHS
jgi:predicted transcriptional regulator